MSRLSVVAAVISGIASISHAWQVEPILDESYGVKQVASGCSFTEGPIVDGSGVLYFSDGPNDRIMRLTPAGIQSVFLQPCGAANGLLFDLQGRILICQSARDGGGRALARISLDAPMLELETLAAEFRGNRFIAPNDLCIDAGGSVYFTDPYYDGEKSQPTSGVYRLDPNGEIKLLIKDLLKPNGILITPDDGFIYVSDRGTQQLHRYQLSQEKTLINDTVIYNFAPDRGIDGMWIDVQGNIYGAAGEGDTTGLFVISPKGKLLLHKPLPEFATNVTFGGADMRDLYVTATTSVYQLRARIPGVPHRYTRNDAADEIKAILRSQAIAWNEGDIPKFMQYYWKSDQLTFSSGGKTRRGWEATRRSYATRYPTREKMGRLTFSGLEVSQQSETVCLVLGNWHLERQDSIGGNFSLIFRRIDGSWRIVHDHTSLATE